MFKPAELKGILFSNEQIVEKAKELGAQITKDFADKDLVLVGILRGSVPWMAELMKHIELDITIDFISCSSYGSAKQTSGTVQILKGLSSSVEGKTVLIVEDVIDSGLTLKYLQEYFADKGADEVKICALVDKPSGRRVEMEGDYIGFVTGDHYLIGFGLDDNQKYRQLPYIGYVEV
ncbi:MAG: hypoxanthine phosphoribosyltransferase [Eubacteriales bacterium]|nr:hypoxanthine phosphoribosyltransferase [Eubacteriales bacterium]MDY3333124.1 hypoxanthine phosphoribosyltransferase [Gallibacter sp.]